MTPPLHLGIVAPEFPPLLGGMAELAGGLSRALATHDRARVFAFPSPGADPAALESEDFPISRHLTGNPRTDGPRLARLPDRVDAWLLLNAGLLPLIPRLEAPAFCYLHGNDFINPWLRCGPAPLEAFRRPYIARVRHALRRRALRRAAPACRHFLTNSHQTAALARRTLGLAADRLTVAHPGVGDAFFQAPEPVQPGKANIVRLLTVTRLSPHTRRKNVDGVLRALALIDFGDGLPGGPNRQPRTWHYTVVGGGTDLPRLQALSGELGIADRVRFTGSVEPDELLAEYRRADLFVLASKATATDVEGFGIVYIEAAAAGVPSLCSREGGATDAVIDGRTGILVERSDPASIADGLRRFAGLELEPAQIRQHAEQFRWPVIAEQVRQVIIDHLGGSLGARREDQSEA